MKRFLILFGLVLMAIPAFAQTNAVSSSRAVGLPDSLPPKGPTTVPLCRTDAWQTNALANIARAKAKAATIELVFDGDSITQLWGSRGKRVWDEAFLKYHPFDFGMAGDTTQLVLWRLSQGQAQGLHPKLIFLMIGTNNMRYKSTPQEIADGVKEIVNQYRTACPDAVIVLQAIFPRGATATDPYRVKVNETNAILAKFDLGPNVIYLDFGAKFLSPDGTLGADVMPDFLHPSEKGYQIWADAILPVIKKYIPDI